MASPGNYKGVAITGGTDAEVAAQMKSIDAAQAPATSPTPGTPPAPTTFKTPSGATVDTNGTVINPGGINPTDLMTEIQNRLLGSSGAISSSNSKIEDTITGAIKSLQDSNEASKGATGLAYDKQITAAKAAADTTERGFLEGQKGFATNTAALKDLRDNNAKSIRDLEDRKQAALLSGDAETAKNVSDLILKKYEFENSAQEQVFNNMVSISNIALQQSQENRLKQSQQFTEDQAKSSIALKYGINVEPGDTFQDVVNRAKPFASKEEQAQLDQAAATLEKTNAETTLARANAEKALKDKNAQDLSTDDFKTFITTQRAADPSVTADALKAKILALPNINATQRKQAYDMIDATFAAEASSASGGSSSSNGSFSSPLLNNVSSFGQGVIDINKSITDYIFGKDKFFGMSNKY